MLLDMDTELQHLISISVEKMTSETTSSLPGRESPKSGGMNLRKALLVAHFLQEVRQAYIEENYEILLNTFTNNKNSDYVSNGGLPCYCQFNKDQQPNEVCTNPKTPCNGTSPTSSSYPACVTNSEVVVSKISQVTRPLSVSVNTSHVMCCKSSIDTNTSKASTDDVTGDGDSPVFCDELDVSSCCEVVSSCASDCDDDPQCSDWTDPRDHVTLVNRIEEVIADGAKSDEKRGPRDESIPNEQVANTSRQPELSPAADNCSFLPKKKRPLPKEYQSVCKTVPAVKTAKTIDNATSTAHAVSLESRTSTSLSTAHSQLKDASSRKEGLFQPSPKVIVQLTQSCDSQRPITCAKIYLEALLGGLATRAF